MESGPTGGEVSDDVSETGGPLGVENLFVPALAAVLAFVVGLIVYQGIASSTSGFVRTAGFVAVVLVFPIAVAIWTKRTI